MDVTMDKLGFEWELCYFFFFFNNLPNLYLDWMHITENFETSDRCWKVVYM